jgi:hypothetical protein
MRTRARKWRLPSVPVYALLAALWLCRAEADEAGPTSEPTACLAYYPSLHRLDVRVSGAADVQGTKEAALWVSREGQGDALGRGKLSLNKQLGVSHEIYPPFTPIQTAGSEVSVVLRKYRLNGFGLWDSVLSQGKELRPGQ